MRRLILLVAITAVQLLGASTAPAYGGEIQVITDPALDTGPLRPFKVPTPTPGWQDIRAGYIAEDAAALRLILRVEDLEPLALPRDHAEYYWEFTLAAPGSAPVPCHRPGNRCVQVTADSLGRSRLAANCTGGNGSPGFVGCTDVPGSSVTTSFDYERDRVEISVRWTDLGNPPAGTTLHEVELFEGIGVATGFSGAYWSGNMDTADLDGEGFYTLQTSRL